MQQKSPGTPPPVLKSGWKEIVRTQKESTSAPVSPSHRQTTGFRIDHQFKSKGSSQSRHSAGNSPRPAGKKESKDDSQRLENGAANVEASLPKREGSLQASSPEVSIVKHHSADLPSARSSMAEALQGHAAKPAWNLVFILSLLAFLLLPLHFFPSCVTSFSYLDSPCFVAVFHYVPLRAYFVFSLARRWYLFFSSFFLLAALFWSSSCFFFHHVSRQLRNSIQLCRIDTALASLWFFSWTPLMIILTENFVKHLILFLI